MLRVKAKERLKRRPETVATTLRLTTLFPFKYICCKIWLFYMLHYNLGNWPRTYHYHMLFKNMLILIIYEKKTIKYIFVNKPKKMRYYLYWPSIPKLTIVSCQLLVIDLHRITHNYRIAVSDIREGLDVDIKDVFL